MSNLEQLLLPVLEQQQQLLISERYRQSNDQAMRHTLESFFAQDDANQRRDNEEALFLFWALAHLGTPGQYRRL
ncbi:hypothetical protein PGT21_004669 [Puccinia graminis f. sp. tritici]|uniref:Uncharacterized protein n=1 Tax=Puccinia graminis f. sp. tritici TaxID=56615 RepID=A0A5B0QI06_PUCGR|nr:hypothetical protein PGT21_004669 [Puccinia graminis f. sp. tritici]